MRIDDDDGGGGATSVDCVQLGRDFAAIDDNAKVMAANQQVAIFSGLTVRGGAVAKMALTAKNQSPRSNRNRYGQ